MYNNNVQRKAILYKNMYTALVNCKRIRKKRTIDNLVMNNLGQKDNLKL